ncbi:MAG: hypothetical protein HZB95_02285 [Nitrosomonadales bacterium]|nr:hypothetical protein [Nitrosomonadales bacterium]
MERTEAEAFHARLTGKFYGMLQWQDLDALWARVKTGQWYLYQIGEDLPATPFAGDDLATRIDALDKLLRQDHDYHLCGIVYADHIEHPTLIKVYDPNSLGSSCSKTSTPPRWILSTAQPALIENHAPTPESRRRWWQMFQSA